MDCFNWFKRLTERYFILISSHLIFFSKVFCWILFYNQEGKQEVKILENMKKKQYIGEIRLRDKGEKRKVEIQTKKKLKYKPKIGLVF